MHAAAVAGEAVRDVEAAGTADEGDDDKNAKGRARFCLPGMGQPRLLKERSRCRQR